MEFESTRTGTGTKEWAEVNENIQLGCQNNCLYCYAAANANRFKIKKRSDWHHEELTKRADVKSYPAREGVVMFPSTHDITPFNLEAYIRVAKLILKKGNRLLIVSKPRYDCISVLLEDLAPWKSQILFRFTIGTMNDASASFWEPGAAPPMTRLLCLDKAYHAGFRTSVSIEPILGSIQNALDVVHCCEDFVTDTIWIGKMNRLRLRVQASEEVIKHVEQQQSDRQIIELYYQLKNHRLIRWKDSIQEVLAKNKVI